MYLLAVNEVVVSKADKMTHEVGRFYSSIAGRPIGGLSFVDVEQRQHQRVHRSNAGVTALSQHPLARGGIPSVEQPDAVKVVQEKGER